MPSLLVTLQRATGLPAADVGGTSDPFVVFSLAGFEQRSSVQKKTLNPEWNEDYLMPVSDPEEALHCDVFDYDAIGRNDRLGGCKVRIDQLVMGRPKEFCLLLSDGQGKLFVMLTAIGFGIDPLLEGSAKDCVKKLVVSVVRARDVTPMDRGGTSDPFVKMSFGAATRQTTVVKKTLNPEWNEVFAFSVEKDDDQRPLLLELLDKDLFKERVIAKASIPLLELTRDRPNAMDVPLVLVSGGAINPTQNVLSLVLTPSGFGKEANLVAEYSDENQANMRRLDTGAMLLNRKATKRSKKRQRAKASIRLTVLEATGHLPVPDGETIRGVVRIKFEDSLVATEEDDNPENPFWNENFNFDCDRPDEPNGCWMHFELCDGDKPLAITEFDVASLYQGATTDLFLRLRALGEPVVMATAVKDDTLNPEWFESFDLDLQGAADRELELTVYDKDVVGSELLGKCRLFLVETLNGAKHIDKWLGLQCKGRTQGKLFITLETEDRKRPQHIRVIINRATDLINADTVGKSDPFVQLRLLEAVTDCHLHVYLTPSGFGKLTPEQAWDKEEQDRIERELRGNLNGEMQVRIIEARGLMAADSNGKSDPFVELWTAREESDGSKKNLIRTKVIKKTLEPKWNETFTVTVQNYVEEDIKLECWDKDLVGRDILGAASMGLAALEREKPVDTWLPLSTQGEVRIEVTPLNFGRKPLGAVQPRRPFPKENAALETAEKNLTLRIVDALALLPDDEGGQFIVRAKIRGTAVGSTQSVTAYNSSPQFHNAMDIIGVDTAENLELEVQRQLPSGACETVGICTVPFAAFPKRAETEMVLDLAIPDSSIPLKTLEGEPLTLRPTGGRLRVMTHNSNFGDDEAWRQFRQSQTQRMADYHRAVQQHALQTVAASEEISRAPLSDEEEQSWKVFTATAAQLLAESHARGEMRQTTFSEEVAQREAVALAAEDELRRLEARFSLQRLLISETDARAELAVAEVAESARLLTRARTTRKSIIDTEVMKQAQIAGLEEDEADARSLLERAAMGAVAACKEAEVEDRLSVAKALESRHKAIEDLIAEEDLTRAQIAEDALQSWELHRAEQHSERKRRETAIEERRAHQVRQRVVLEEDECTFRETLLQTFSRSWQELATLAASEQRQAQLRSEVAISRRITALAKAVPAASRPTRLGVSAAVSGGRQQPCYGDRPSEFNRIDPEKDVLRFTVHEDTGEVGSVSIPVRHLPDAECHFWAAVGNEGDRVAITIRSENCVMEGWKATRRKAAAKGGDCQVIAHIVAFETEGTAQLPDALCVRLSTANYTIESTAAQRERPRPSVEWRAAERAVCLGSAAAGAEYTWDEILTVKEIDSGTIASEDLLVSLVAGHSAAGTHADLVGAIAVPLRSLTEATHVRIPISREEPLLTASLGWLTVLFSPIGFGARQSWLDVDVLRCECLPRTQKPMHAVAVRLLLDGQSALTPPAFGKPHPIGGDFQAQWAQHYSLAVWPGEQYPGLEKLASLLHVFLEDTEAAAVIGWGSVTLQDLFAAEEYRLPLNLWDSRTCGFSSSPSDTVVILGFAPHGFGVPPPIVEAQIVEASGLDLTQKFSAQIRLPANRNGQQSLVQTRPCGGGALWTDVFEVPLENGQRPTAPMIVSVVDDLGRLVGSVPVYFDALHTQPLDLRVPLLSAISGDPLINELGDPITVRVHLNPLHCQRFKRQLAVTVIEAQNLTLSGPLTCRLGTAGGNFTSVKRVLTNPSSALSGVIRWNQPVVLELETADDYTCPPGSTAQLEVELLDCTTDTVEALASVPLENLSTGETTIWAALSQGAGSRGVSGRIGLQLSPLGFGNEQLRINKRLTSKSRLHLRARLENPAPDTSVMATIFCPNGAVRRCEIHRGSTEGASIPVLPGEEHVAEVELTVLDTRTGNAVQTSRLPLRFLATGENRIELPSVNGHPFAVVLQPENFGSAEIAARLRERQVALGQIIDEENSQRNAISRETANFFRSLRHEEAATHAAAAAAAATVAVHRRNKRALVDPETLWLFLEQETEERKILSGEEEQENLALFAARLKAAESIAAQRRQLLLINDERERFLMQRHTAALACELAWERERRARATAREHERELEFVDELSRLRITAVPRFPDRAASFPLPTGHLALHTAFTPNSLVHPSAPVFPRNTHNMYSRPHHLVAQPRNMSTSQLVGQVMRTEQRAFSCAAPLGLQPLPPAVMQFK
eukprot:TRINITY_DN3423_c1_g1_i1.p1 TRINITY_DN3423_c1_g1~~TRINITY_DN3423_c1_g1_i1.p1  ORF type:complete len:2211 (+),score=349.52 TRINITY_DN3423_c1_g1_i1:64-6696(+)